MSGREFSALGVAILTSVLIRSWIVWSERPVLTPLTVGDMKSANEQTRAQSDVSDVDEAYVDTLRGAAEAAPNDVSPRLSLGDLFFTAQRFEAAIPWYEEVLVLSPENVDASTKLGVSYYYTGQIARSIETFEKSLTVDPTHQRALLSLGIVKAFGLQDLDGAMVAWEQVIEIEPDSEEGRAAQDSLDRIRATHGSSGAEEP